MRKEDFELIKKYLGDNAYNFNAVINCIHVMEQKEKLDGTD